MKMLILVVLLALTACTSPTSGKAANAQPAPAEVKPAGPRNFATENVKLVDKAAECLDQYNDAGENHLYSATCTLSSKLVVSCTYDTVKGFSCIPLNGSPPTAEAPKTPKK